jgi:hypothetical protein
VNTFRLVNLSWYLSLGPEKRILADYANRETLFKIRQKTVKEWIFIQFVDVAYGFLASTPLP